MEYNNFSREQHPALSSAATMCTILQKARDLRCEGNWFGSSHGYHPRGIRRGPFLFVNEWSTHNYCKVYLSQDPEAEWLDAEDCPRAWGVRAIPKPKGEVKLIQVWSSGSWLKTGPWCEKINEILWNLETEILEKEKVKLAKENLNKSKSIEEKNKRDQALIDAYSN